MQEYQRIRHTFEPIYNKDSKILILGSFPSVKSRENGFYYGHPQNRFWKVTSEVFGVQEPKTINEKKKMLYETKIAVWDVIESCDIIGSSDTSIKNVIPNDLQNVIENSSIQGIFTNGKTAGKLYGRFLQEKITVPMRELPSTSPANAVYTLEKLINAWHIIKEIR